MKKEIAEKWVKALRSGDYKQGFGRLRDSRDNFCCLGVLCNLHAIEHPEISSSQFDKESYCNSRGFLPEIVMSWANISFMSGAYSGNSLSYLNDRKYDFAYIANVIEQNWKDL